MAESAYIIGSASVCRKYPLLSKQRVSLGGMALSRLPAPIACVLGWASKACNYNRSVILSVAKNR
jgi:hypothetical protein